jgi:hypothetical protein
MYASYLIEISEHPLLTRYNIQINQRKPDRHFQIRQESPRLPYYHIVWILQYKSANFYIIFCYFPSFNIILH